MTPQRTLARSGRVEAFSDGVLAIAITLLVLDLQTDFSRGAFGHELAHHYFSYLAYIASFINIGVIWMNHHAMFSRIKQVDPTMLWLNLYLLATTSVLPFPTALLARALQDGTTSDRTAATAVYAVVSALMGSSWLILYRHLARNPVLLIDAAEAGAFHSAEGRAIIGFATYSLTAVLSAVVPIASAILIFALPVFYGFTSHSVAFDAAEADAGALVAG